MTNSWAMLYDDMNSPDLCALRAAHAREKANLEDNKSKEETRYIESIPGAREAILEGMATPSEDLLGEEELEWWDKDDRDAPNNYNMNNAPKDTTFWKYSEGKILREVEAYLSSTYKGHYVGEDSKIQTLDLIDSIGDAEPFCRSNAIKYLTRFGKKDGKNPKDLLKVIHYAFLLYHFSDLPFTEDAVETFSPTGR